MYKEVTYYTFGDLISRHGTASRFVELPFNTLLTQLNIPNAILSHIQPLFDGLYKNICYRCFNSFVWASSDEIDDTMLLNFVAWLNDSVDKFTLELEAENLSIDDIKKLSNGKTTSTSSSTSQNQASGTNSQLTKQNDTPNNAQIGEEYQMDTYLSGISKSDGTSSNNSNTSMSNTGSSESFGDKLDALTKLQNVYNDIVSRWTDKFIATFVIYI